MLFKTTRINVIMEIEAQSRQDFGFWGNEGDLVTFVEPDECLSILMDSESNPENDLIEGEPIFDPVQNIEMTLAKQEWQISYWGNFNRYWN